MRRYFVGGIWLPRHATHRVAVVAKAVAVGRIEIAAIDAQAVRAVSIIDRRRPIAAEVAATDERAVVDAACAH